MLNHSQRSWKLRDSPRLKLFASVASNRVVEGPLITLRPAFPTRLTPAGGLAKQAVLKNCSNLCGALLFGSQIMSGRAPEGELPSNPNPAGSFDEVAGLNPSPVKYEVIPESCHPPNNFS